MHMPAFQPARAPARSMPETGGGEEGGRGGEVKEDEEKEKEVRERVEKGG